MDRDNAKHQVELGEVFEQSRQNQRQLVELRQDFNSAINKIGSKMDWLGERITTASAPNFANMAAWAVVVLMVIGAVASPIGYFAIREFDRSERGSDKLDDKLQKEYQLVTAKTDAAIEALNRASIERHTDALDQVHRLQNELDNLTEFRDGQLRDDLNELRNRRYREMVLPPATKP